MSEKEKKVFLLFDKEKKNRVPRTRHAWRKISIFTANHRGQDREKKRIGKEENVMAA